MGEWFRNLIGAAKFRILRFGVFQHFAVLPWHLHVSPTELQYLPVEQSMWPSGKGAWLGTGICTPGLPALFWGETYTVGAAKEDRSRMIYIFHIFFEKEFPPISWICSPLASVLFAFQFPNTAEKAHQISTEKEALLRSLALLRERQKAPVAGTATRVGTTFWPIARWVPRRSVFLPVSTGGIAVDFPC